MTLLPANSLAADSLAAKASGFRTLHIGAVAVDPALILAPMSGVTNSCFRRLIKELNPGSVGLVVTEFISVEGLTRQNAQSMRMMSFAECERPISVQIFGYDIDRMADAAKMAEDAGADIVDINSGCPVPKVVKKGGGCELMRQPEHLGRILRAVKRAIRVPLTLKIRAGWDEKNLNAPEIARMAQEEGVSMLAVHGRTRVQLYRGEADWQIIERIAEQLSIPVVGSGDIVSVESARLRQNSAVRGLMIGRAALSNPWVFSELQAGLCRGEFVRPGAVATVDILERYLALLLESVPEKSAVGRMKQLASQVTRRVRGSADVRQSLCYCRSANEFREVLQRWREQLELGERNGINSLGSKTDVICSEEPYSNDYSPNAAGPSHVGVQ